MSFSKPMAWLASSVIMLCSALIFVLPQSRLQAQQNSSRQLVQTNEQRPIANRRIALVIGNGAYTSAPPLKNPPNDARDMAANLKTLGFDVSSGVNVSQREMKRLIREFGQKLKAGGSGLFYYAGHGVQARGRNYIIPVDAEIQSEADVEDSGVDVGLVLNYMDDAQNGLNIVILDACRNNPFTRSFRSATDGLAQVDAPTGTLIAYATAPGRVAADGAGENGLYTSELLKAMRLPGLSATDMFMQVRAEVMKKTGNKQVPWESSSLVGSFYFSAAAPLTGASSNAPKYDAAAFELTYWDSIKTSTNVEDFNSYLKRYPTGQFADLAKNRVDALKNVPVTTSGVPPKSAAGAWAVPAVEGDASCLDEPCKVIRRVVAAAPDNFKSIRSSQPYADGSYSLGSDTTPSSDVIPKDFFNPDCKVFDERPGLAAAFYFCSYSALSTETRQRKDIYRSTYERLLSGFGRALPGWVVNSRQVSIGGNTWTIATAGPSDCKLEACPVKLRLLDKEWPYGELGFEVESTPAQPQEILSAAFKAQFYADIKAMFAASSSSHVLRATPTFARLGACSQYGDCEIGPLPMGRVGTLYELAKQAVQDQHPDWKVEQDENGWFKAKPPSCRVESLCGAVIYWEAKSDGYLLKLSDNYR